MKKYLVVMFAVAFLLAGFLFVDSRGPSAQRITKPTPEKQQVMPEVVVLGKNAKLGRVTFNHQSIMAGIQRGWADRLYRVSSHRSACG
ncbi:MAG: hypothetical protein IPP63_13965 [Chloracidobacterium sp.]|nr:hypothetical protein [Chloracidobacterium sp.]